MKKPCVVTVLFLTLLFFPLIFFSTAAADYITNTTNDQINPGLAHNPAADEYLVVWQHTLNETNQDIQGQRVADDGSLIGSVISIAAASKIEGRPAVVYNFVSGEYLVVYEYAYSSSDYDIYAQRLSRDGSRLGSPISVAAAAAFEGHPTVVVNTASGEFLIAWEQRMGSGEFTQNDLYARRLDKNGNRVGTIITLQTGSLDESTPALAYSFASDRYLAVWQEKQPSIGAYNIHGHPIGSDGSLPGNEITLAAWEHDLIKPRVTYNHTGDEFMVIWEDHRWAWGAARDIYGQRLNPAGVLIGGNFAISWEGANLRLNPDVVYKPAADEYLAVWEYEYDPGDHDIYARRIGQDGTLIEGELAVSRAGSFEGRPLVASDNELGYLAAWEYGPGGTSQDIDIYGKIIPLHEFSGHVYAGNVGEVSNPLSDVPVELFCSNSSGNAGTLIDGITTDIDGRFGLRIAGTCEFYNLIETDPPDYVSAGSTSVGGSVQTDNWIQYLHPLAGKSLSDNRFWDKEVIPPGNWTGFDPAGWVSSQTVSCSVQVRDTISGLDVVSARYAYSKDGGTTWSDWLTGACSGSGGTTGFQTIIAPGVPFGQDSGPVGLNRIKFRIADMAGNTGTSEAYYVRIDSLPPVIVAGPAISEITADSAMVSWTTDEPATSIVKYDRQAGGYNYRQDDLELKTNHFITLSDLEPSSVYHYIVESADFGGRATISRDIMFETLPLPDAVDPSVTVYEPLQKEGLILLSADAADNTKIERVEFYIDDQQVHTVYSGPYKFWFDTQALANGRHDFTAKAFDSAGNIRADSTSVTVENPVDAAAPTVTITAPVKDDVLSGKKTVTASVSDDQGILNVKFKVDGQWYGDWFPDSAKTKTATVNFTLDTYGLKNGKHRLAVEVFDEDINYAFDTVDISVSNTPPPPPPKLVVKRSVTRSQNYFTVTLTVTNAGGQTATDVSLQDDLQLFQPISDSDAVADYKAVFKPELSKAQIRITAHQPIGGGQTVTFSYQAVPVLQYPLVLTPMIGGSKYGQLTDVWYLSAQDGNNYYDRLKLASIQSAEYTKALSEADYLLVTNPRNLVFFNNEKEVNKLLSSMAELARLKNGVLGYLHTTASFTADYEDHDGFALADLTADNQQEVIIGDRSSDVIAVFRNLNKQVCYKYMNRTICYAINWQHLKNFKCGQNETGFEAGDRIAGGRPAGAAKDQIVMTDASADRILIYDDSGKEVGNLPHSLEPYDGLDLGDVNGDGVDEILLAGRNSGLIEVLNIWGNTISSFSKTVEPHDGFAAGDVIYGDAEEIIFVDRSLDKVFIFNMNGGILASFTFNFEEGDGLTVGNVIHTYPQDKDEIIISDWSANRIYIFNSSGYLFKSIKRQLDSFDGLAAGDLTGISSDSILLADDSDNAIVLCDLGQTENDQKLLADLIKTAGAWSSKLKSGWTSNGYLLIVGEIEIIPAWGDKTYGQVYTTRGDITLRTNATDYPYANTTGSEIKPELSIGRIIGNSARDLRTAIETSINVAEGKTGYGFDRTQYFLVSGFPSGLGGGADNIDFKKERDSIYNLILKTYPSAGRSTMHTPDYTQYDPSTGQIDPQKTQDTIKSVIFNLTADKDAIFLAGHGHWSGWDVIDAWDVNEQVDPLGDKNPVVYASSCSTGNYMAGFSIAEGFLRRDAAGYIGATIFGLGSHASISKKFFEKWTLAKTAGQALKETKQSLGSGSSDKYYIGIYHFFGDPKFGAIQTGAQAYPSEDVFPEALQDITVDVPDYEVTRVEGVDNVEIPGGLEYCLHGYPRVPYYRVFYNYPKDYVIQDVLLAYRGEALPASGFNLLNCVVALGDSEDTVFQNNPPEIPAWWPERIYEWEVVENPDSITLAITLYPFYYNPSSGGVRFHRQYQFAVDYFVSGIQLPRLDTDQDVYAPGEPVRVDLVVENTSAEAQDLIMYGVIKKEDSDRVVSGLLLQSMKYLAGSASYATTWNSAGFEPGYYRIEVELKDRQDRVLVRKSKAIRLGITSGQISDFSVQPTHFTIGDTIDRSMQFTNTGTTDINGIAVLQVRDADDAVIDEMRYNITDLFPDNSVQFDDTWESSGEDEGTYSIVGYVLYDGKITPPRMVSVSTDPPCAGDFNTDGDVDGTDLAIYASGLSEMAITKIADNFGRTDCPPDS